MAKLKSCAKFVFLAGLFFLLSAASCANAANVGDIVNFNVDKNFDASARTQVPSTLVKVGPKLHFYIEKTWWDSQTQIRQAQIVSDLEGLSAEFDSKIYPTITSSFGYEWSPGIDRDNKITILFESMNSSEGGYFREADEYEKLQLPDSNQREMLYLSTSMIGDSRVKAVLGHELMHLITFNQKNKIYGVEEDTWLNEARADYVSTILGYDDIYIGSNLRSRVNDFIENPSDSITDWQGTKYDYASVSLFTNYLIDHYGLNILSDSLRSKSIGIQSINEALLRGGNREDFARVFTNWTIALAINDCSQNKNYCYINKNLASLRISPTLIFLPLMGSSSLSATNVTKNWAGNWQKIIGGTGDLKLYFSGLAGLSFRVPYIIYNKENSYSVNYFGLDQSEKGEIDIKDFGTKYNSLIVIPSLQSKASGFDEPDLIYPYSIKVSITGKDSQIEDQATIERLLAQIESLKKQIAAIIAKGQGNSGNQNNSCSQIASNLSVGMTGNQVSCLQTFLKNQGVDIYPSGLITGNFGNLTKTAVIKFQEKYSIPKTGYVGILTRTKINQLLNG